MSNSNQPESQWLIASVSWGKDSLAMLHLLLDEKNTPDLNEVVFFDTGMEFEAIYRERDRMLPVLASMGIEYTELKPKEPFLHKMFVHPVKSRETGEIHKYGYGWCGGACLYDVLDRVSCWCCRNKNQRELRAIHDHLPRYWQQLLALESRLGTMKSKPLPEIAGA